MPFQIHAMVQEPKHIDHLAVRSAGDPEHHEMSTLAPVTRDMKGPDAGADFRAFPGADRIRAGSQGLQCQGKEQ